MQHGAQPQIDHFLGTAGVDVLALLDQIAFELQAHEQTQIGDAGGMTHQVQPCRLGAGQVIQKQGGLRGGDQAADQVADIAAIGVVVDARVGLLLQGSKSVGDGGDDLCLACQDFTSHIFVHEVQLRVTHP